jgi:NAD(P)-dependent dehydrogenase (short-subunit alcohol dehydrogenase family)
MIDHHGKVAVVTGAASGIGFGLAQRFAEEGMKVVMADVEQPALSEAEHRLKEKGEILSVHTDVSKEEDVQELARTTLDTFGRVDVLCNNAGVAVMVPLWAMTPNDWKWVGGVNLEGCLFGIRAFVPIMIQQDEGWVINTSSIGGVSTAAWGGYGVTKHAIVACTEALHHGLQSIGSNVKVAVLLPGWTRTQIVQAERNRPPELENDQPPDLTPAVIESMETLAKAVESGIEPSEVAGLVIDAMEQDRFYIFTHPETLPMVQFRMEDILQGRPPTGLG